MPVVDLSGLNFTAFSIASLPGGIENISLQGNQLNTLVMSSASAVINVYASGNRLVSLAWDQLPSGLKVLDVDHNLIETADFSHLPPGLTVLSQILGYGALGTVNPLRTATIGGTIPPAFTSIEMGGASNILESIVINPTSSTQLRAVDLSNNRLSSVPLSGLPPTLMRLNVSNNSIAEFDFAALPANLATLDVSLNKIQAVALGASSSALQELYVSGNAVTSVAYSTLPGALRRLVLRSNQLAGPLTWAARLTKLQWLDVSLNKFSGPLDFTAFPTTLTTLVAGNQLSGTVNWALLHSFTIENLWIQFNQLSGPLDMSFLKYRQETMENYGSFIASHNQFSGSVTLPPCNSETYGWWDYIDVSFNALSGPLNLTAIGCLNYFIASNNRFSGPMNLPSMPGYLADVSNNAFSGAFSLPSGMWYFRDQLNISGRKQRPLRDGQDAMPKYRGAGEVHDAGHRQRRMRGELPEVPVMFP
jgi:hypothetical protein